LLIPNVKEVMAIMAGRLIKNEDILFCGTGLSLIAAAAAKKMYAPGCVMFFETGAIDSLLMEIPLNVSDLRVMYGSSVNAGLMEAFSLLALKKIHTKALLGAAQIDKYGNLNSTCIGDYWHPATRFSGSGGACDAGCLAAEVIVFMQHERRRFVEKLDYLTSPGWLTGAGSREAAGLYRGGPSTVITDLGILKFAEKTKEMYLAEYYPGVAPAQVREKTGFAVDIASAVESRPITNEEIHLLREQVDPQKLVI
jgi:glutaconate CoA-transferase subunit B